jgi:DNA processing protein
MIGVGVDRSSEDLAPAAVPTEPRRPDRPHPDHYAHERDAWTVLAAIDGLGPVAFTALLTRYGTGSAILRAAGEPDGPRRLASTPSREHLPGERVRAPVTDAVAAAIAAAADSADTTLERVRSAGLRVITMEEPAYPRRLAAIAMPPHVLFVRGSAAALSPERAVAVVGTRRPTTYGRRTAGRIATALAAAEATVVSGLAYGVDGAAHEATVRAGGQTIAVIGGGHAALSPRAHDRLAAAIVDARGAVISEYAPHVIPTVGTFPRRNRIISGLTDATVVVEAPARSGALITASWALEQGRECFIVPGPIDSAASAGVLGFLREWPDAARIVAGVPQLIADLGLVHCEDAMSHDGVVAATLQGLGEVESVIARAIVGGRVTVDEIVASSGLTVASVLAALVMLERRGLVAGVQGRYRPSGTLVGADPTHDVAR